MGLLKPNPLDSHADLLPRLIFRMFWSAAGLAIVTLTVRLLEWPWKRWNWLALLGALVVIPLLGLLIDWIRLEDKHE